ncbi:hypothetical protein [Nocardioides sp. AX2bis]|uniref:hypothetical protein n=1 Tax=Nocardioides sp. AX2bis TaxID=2653157 RepID=UPI0012F296D0|nr:hypothetical protein [Nocardioides sp. AX2bis]VXB57047.1 conserved exported hypothetical protein [Nocardioides sp. AX2bis]
MRITKAAVAATLVLGVAAPLGLASPVHAATEVVVDPAGDAGGPQRLDVTRAAVRNDDRLLVARVSLAEDRRGDVIVSVDPRGDSGLRLVATKKTDGSVREQILPGAFTDGGDVDGPTPCRGLRVRWAEDVARLAMPSACLHDGDYGAVRFSVLTENGADSDVAPDRGTSGWIPRG